MARLTVNTLETAPEQAKERMEMAKSQWLYPKSDWRVGKFTTST